jgi:hypothetical protein
MILPFAREQEVEARWFYFWSVEVVEGDDWSAQQVNAELLHRVSHFPQALLLAIGYSIMEELRQKT